jgi:hypothetical protein
VKRIAAIVSIMLAATAAAREPVPVWIAFTDQELQRAKRTALHAMNSPEVWARFPKPKRTHQVHYTPLLRGISYGFSKARGLDTVTVVIPTTHIGPRHRAVVHVIFDQGLKIIDIVESLEL